MKSLALATTALSLLAGVGCRQQIESGDAKVDGAEAVSFLVSAGADLEEARTADARAIPVTMCTQGNPGCHACRDAAQGLEVAAQVTVE
ncbi:MAG TPA: hypothetical protein VMS76_12550, partial [Planctomycetota bacterium]|nr:hypothetical protein [Planctomycetota bacterium]